MADPITVNLTNVINGEDKITVESISNEVINGRFGGGNTDIMRGNTFIPNIDDTVPKIDTISDLRALTTPIDRVWVSGYHIKGDGAFGSLVFQWDSTSTEADDGGTVFKIVGQTIGRYKLKYARYLNVKVFGVVGSNPLETIVDETTSIQKALNHKGELEFDGDKVYGFTNLKIYTNTYLKMNGGYFKKMTSSVTDYMEIVANARNVEIDWLEIETSSNSAGDRVIVIRDGTKRIHLGALVVRSDYELTYDDNNTVFWACEIGKDYLGANQSSKIDIDYIEVKNMNTAVFAKNVHKLNIGGGEHTKFRNSIFLSSCTKTRIDDFSAIECANSVDGGPGENAILIETSSEPTMPNSEGIVINNCHSYKSGEHGFRLGGQRTIKNVTFNDCTSKKSGSSITINNPNATEWHGGCGFKILGATTVINEKHSDITFNNCKVEDTNDTFGSFPNGHSDGNFAGFQVAVAEHVRVNGCSVRKKDNTYSSGYGAEILASNDVKFDGCVFEDMHNVIRTYEAGNVGAYPGWDYGCEDIEFHNTRVKASNPSRAFTIGDAYQNYIHQGIRLKNVTIDGTSKALKVEPVTGTGGYKDLSFEFTHINSQADHTIATEPPIYGDLSEAYYDIKAELPINAYYPSGKIGSKIQDKVTGVTFQRTLYGFKPLSNYVLNIADDDVKKIKAPEILSGKTGILEICGSGTREYAIMWYRTSLSPASIKINGGTSVDNLNSELTGTTGTDGNITVGIQTDFIYIENRSGSAQQISVNLR